MEQNLSGAAEVVERVCAGAYGEQFRAWFGNAACTQPQQGYNAIAQAIAAYEASPEVNAFSSKYDYYLKDPQRYPLSEQEQLGLELFDAEDKGNCAACHPSAPGPNGEPPLFTDFTYDNLGTPRNPDNPWYGMTAFNADGAGWVDEGLGGFLKTVPRFADRAAENLGKHKVPTLRNVDRRPSPGLCQVLYAQRLAEDAEGERALLQHARHQADLRGAGDAEARRQLLACAGGGRQRQYGGTWRSGADGGRRAGHRCLHAHVERRLDAAARDRDESWANARQAGIK